MTDQELAQQLGLGGWIPEDGLYVIADRGVTKSFFAWIEALVELGTTGLALQVRAKEATPDERAHAVAIVRAAGGRPVLNGTSAEALATGAWGVHWPESALATAEGPGPTEGLQAVGASVHSRGAALQAAAAGAQFLVYGPVFDPGSKPGAGVGVGALAHFVAGTSLPVFAVGGITPDRMAACRAAGAAGVAVVSGVMSARDRVAAVKEYRAAWEAARPR
jgi:thiamine-phosphate pyrophosphorylase